MEHWDLRTLAVEPHQPQILHSARGEARTIAINLPQGERCRTTRCTSGRTWSWSTARSRSRTDDEAVSGGPGFAAVFDPHERHEVRATTDARLLLVLAPWPGDGHPGARD